VRSVREECLNRMILMGQTSLRRAMTQFVAHYHSECNHQGLGNQLIQPGPTPLPSTSVLRRQRLGGMLSFYYPGAA
jgi:putative transposase